MKYGIKKLRQLGKEQGIKYSSHINSKTLCEKLNLPYERNASFDAHNKDKILIPVGILGVDPITGERLVEFLSIYRTAKYLGINPRYVYVYIKSKKIVEVFGNKVILIRKP